MLIKPSIDELENISEDRYLITTLAARRSKDLVQGLKAITEEEEVSKVSQAAKEMAEGLITYKEHSL